MPSESVSEIMLGITVEFCHSHDRLFMGLMPLDYRIDVTETVFRARQLNLIVVKVSGQ